MTANQVGSSGADFIAQAAMTRAGQILKRCRGLWPRNQAQVKNLFCSIKSILAY
jgi:hypothetical protein